VAIFLRKCDTAPRKLIVRSKADSVRLGSVNEHVGVSGPHDVSLRNSVQLHEPRQMCRLLHIAAMITQVL
jgi:hypothetical protein